MAHEKIFKTVEEAQSFIQPWIDKVSAELGCGVEPYSYNDDYYMSGGQNVGDWFYGAHLKYLGFNILNEGLRKYNLRSFRPITHGDTEYKSVLDRECGTL